MFNILYYINPNRVTVIPHDKPSNIFCILQKINSIFIFVITVKYENKDVFDRFGLIYVCRNKEIRDDK